MFWGENLNLVSGYIYVIAFLYNNPGYQHSEFKLLEALFNIYVAGCLVKHFFMHLGCHLYNNQTPLQEYSLNIQDWWATPDDAINIDMSNTAAGHRRLTGSFHLSHTRRAGVLAHVYVPARQRHVQRA